MSITKTKEQIARVDRASLYQYGATVIRSGEDLHALASSHTRLLTAIKNYLKPHVNDAQAEMAHKELWEAIEEAER